MLDKIFHSVNGVVQLNEKSLLEVTDQKFVGLVAPLIGGAPIKNMRMKGSRKDASLYFSCRGVIYSFAYNRRQLIFSEFDRGRWKFIVGWLNVHVV